jgi:cobalt/nickel transport system permease protein
MFGIQPLLHTDAAGIPLYMPYGLNVALPAMLAEHVFFFSFVEAAVTALIFVYIQKTDPSLLMYDRPTSKRLAKGAAA